jgi:branched-chain amino acid transport system substrate-binding protein
VNMGPYYSATGAAQAIVSRGAKSVVGATSSAPGNEYNNDGAVLVGQAAGLPTDSVFIDTPITDPSSTALDLYNRAGDGGGVVLTFTAPDALPILQAAEQQGLLDKVLWSCATPCNDSRVAAALGPQWNDHFFVNAEFNLLDTTGPDEQHYVALVEEYAPDEAARLSSFGQMGYLAGKFMTEALLQASSQGELTVESVNAAVKGLLNQPTDILCKPWYFGDFPTHLPNNTDYTVSLQDNVFVEADPCFDIAAVNDQIQQVREDEAGLIEQGLLSPTDAITDLGYTPPA